MSKHTPGPWRWGFWKRIGDETKYEFRPVSEAPEDGDEDLVLAACEYGVVVSPLQWESLEILQGTAIADKNMTIIAATPKLLAACKEAVAMDDSAHCDHDPWLTPDVRDMMTAAIPEAENEKPCKSRSLTPAITHSVPLTPH